MALRAREYTAGKEKSDNKSMKVKGTSYVEVVWVNVSFHGVGLVGGDIQIFLGAAKIAATTAKCPKPVCQDDTSFVSQPQNFPLAKMAIR